jgi:hypothetical protein
MPLWLGIYVLLMIVIIPSLICFILNFIIFKYVRSSTKRVQPSLVVTQNNQRQYISRRDLHLLRHMIFIFCVFIVGWSPVYVYSLIPNNSNYLIFLIFQILAQSSVLIGIINLFFYNHKLRRYFFQKIFRC